MLDDSLKLYEELRKHLGSLEIDLNRFKTVKELDISHLKNELSKLTNLQTKHSEFWKVYEINHSSVEIQLTNLAAELKQLKVCNKIEELENVHAKENRILHEKLNILQSSKDSNSETLTQLKDE